MIVSMLGYQIILYLLIIINKKMYNGELGKFGFSTKKKISAIIKGVGLGAVLVMGLYLSSLLFSSIYTVFNDNFNLLVVMLFTIGFFFQGMAE